VKILDKYIISEMLGPFVFGVATFTILFFAGGQMTVVTRMIAEGNATVGQALSYAFNTLPAIFVLTFPMGVLLSALLAFGRLSGESELIAMRAGGIGFIRTVLPAILLALLISIGVFLLNNYVVPDSTYHSRNLFIEHFLKTDNSIVENMILRETHEDGTETLIFFKRLLPDEDKMENVTIQYFKKNKRTREVFADEAYYKTDVGKWYLKVARITSYGDDLDSQYVAISEEVLMPLGQSPQELSGERERRHEEMDLATLRKNISHMKQDLERLKMSGETDEIPRLQRRINLFYVSYHEKIAVPFACFIFALFAIPLAIRPHRTSRAFGLGLSIIFIFVYYVLISAGHTLGENGQIPPFFGAWFANIIFAISGILLLVKKASD
jgi:lipopolysaccharide export system permease protein